jgi:hypothetical protein
MIVVLGATLSACDGIVLITYQEVGVCHAIEGQAGNSPNAADYYVYYKPVS